MRRAAALLVVCAGGALLLSFDSLHAGLLDVLAAAEPLVRAYPVSGAAVFVLLSALSAMLAFFSGALLVPVAVHNWGQPATIALLWAGWLLGGMFAYGLGRGVGRPLATAIGVIDVLDAYRARLPDPVPFALVLLVQLALPSEIPGYLFGLARTRFATYVAALALAEIPFAIGTVLAGDGVLQQRGWVLMAAGTAGAVLIVVAHRVLRRRLRRDPPDA